jgi:4-hydroxybenzoate polyprenyltransferase
MLQKGSTIGLQEKSVMQTSKKHKTDIREDAFIFKYMPQFLKPFARLARWDRPIGVALLYLPCLWGLALASRGHGYIREFILFGLGAILMRGAGCTYNDMVDRKIDRQVTRTATRPLARGDISLFGAALFLGLQLSLSLFILYLLPEGAIALGYIVMFFVFLYPWAKRFTYWPQLILGMTFNWGVLIAWASLNSRFGLSAFLMYFAGIFWTLAYDTIYAHQDKESDALIGVKSTALRFGSKTKPYLAVFYALMIGITLASGIIENMRPGFYAMLTLTGFYTFWIFLKVNLDDPLDCLQKFKLNAGIGLMIYFAFTIGRW